LKQTRLLRRFFNLVDSLSFLKLSLKMYKAFIFILILLYFVIIYNVVCNFILKVIETNKTVEKGYSNLLMFKFFKIEFKCRYTAFYINIVNIFKSEINNNV